MRNLSRRHIAIALALIVVVAAGAASVSQPSLTSSDPDSKTVVAQGSSTVFPLTVEIGNRFEVNVDPEAEIVVNSVGSSGGFRLFGTEANPPESDISNSSRAIRSDEIATLADRGIEYSEALVGFDGLTVAVNIEDNIFADGVQCMTLGELALLWDPASEGVVNNWSQLGSRFNDQEIILSGAADTSGTYDFYTELVNGDAGRTRTDYFPTEDDTILVDRVASTPNELTYFGFAFFINNADVLGAVAIDPRTDAIDADQATLDVVNAKRENDGLDPITNGGGTCNGVVPSADSIGAFDYQLTRPLFFYVNHVSAERETVDNFVNYYLNQVDPVISSGTPSDAVSSVGYVNASDTLVEAAKACFAQRINGSAFDGQFVGLSSAELTSLYTAHCGTAQ